MFGTRKLLSNEVKLEVPVPDFIPYACHYDSNTVLTKNGELLQIIKITGFTFENVLAEHMDLRDVIRKSVQEHVKSDKFALWFHTVRRHQNLNPAGEYPNGFSKFLHASWSKKNAWNRQYVNELYITIIHEGKPFKVTKSLKDMFGSLFFSQIKKQHMHYLKESHQHLVQVVDGMLDILKDYGARRLTIVERKTDYCSEPLKFFGKIMHLAEEDMPMPVMDLSDYLATHQIAFGNNELEVIGKTGKHFGGILTVKEYHEISTKAIDHFLQLPMQFIISQSINFLNSKSVLKQFEYQKYIIQVSGDERYASLSGLTDIMESNRGLPTDYGEHQLSIMILEDSLDGLKGQLNLAADTLANMGIVTVREDLRLEQCFWSQLPANFSSLCRKKPINTNRVGGFASLHNFPAGQPSGNAWGPAATVFRTIQGTPYFFSFHVQDNGHSVIIGPLGSGKTVLMNFMISESRKFNNKLFFFDQHRAGKVFINALGGKYTNITPAPKAKEEQGYFNPLLLKDNKVNRKFLEHWFGYLLTAQNEVLNEEALAYITKLVNSIFNLPQEKRRLSYIAEVAGGVLKARLSDWYGEGKYATLFDNDKDLLDEGLDINGFGITEVIEEDTPLRPVIAYLFHRIERGLDGTPTMIVLDEAWKVVNNPLFADIIGHWLERLKKKNAMVIFAAESIDDASTSEITPVIAEQIATQIFMPNPDAEKSRRAYKDVWGLSDKEFHLLTEMRSEQRNFLLRQGHDTIVAELDLADLDAEVAILSGSDDTVKVMEEAMAETGNQPSEWLPVFQKKILGL